MELLLLLGVETLICRRAVFCLESERNFCLVGMSMSTLYRQLSCLLDGQKDRERKGDEMTLSLGKRRKNDCHVGRSSRSLVSRGIRLSLTLPCPTIHVLLSLPFHWWRLRFGLIGRRRESHVFYERMGKKEARGNACGR